MLDAAFRKAIVSELGGCCEPAELRYLNDQEMFSGYEYGLDEDEDGLQVERAAASILALRQYRSRHEPTSRRGEMAAPRELDARAVGRGRGSATARVMAAVATLLAENLPEVARFRKQYLGMRLLKRESISQFLQEQSQVIEGRQSDRLSYDGEFYRGTRGAVPALLRVARRLNDKFGWTQTQAVEFVLTGDPPRGPAIMTSIYNMMPQHARITLDVPAYFTPDEVARVYQRATSNVRRCRFSDHVAQVVEFFAERIVGGATASQAAREWHEQTGHDSETARREFNRVMRALGVVSEARRDAHYLDLIKRMGLGDERRWLSAMKSLLSDRR